MDEGEADREFPDRGGDGEKLDRIGEGEFSGRSAEKERRLRVDRGLDDRDDLQGEDEEEFESSSLLEEESSECDPSVLCLLDRPRILPAEF